MAADTPAPQPEPAGDEPTPAQAAQPPSTNDKRTIVVGPQAVAPTTRLPELPPSADSPAGAAGPTAPASAPGRSGDTTPTAAYAVPTLYPTQPAPPQRGRMWLVIGLCAALGLVTITALVLGLTLIIRERTATGQPSVVAEPVEQATSPAPSPTPATRPTAQAGATFGTTLLKETFDNPLSSSLTDGETDTVSYNFVAGAYAISLKQPNYIVWSPINGIYSNVAVDLDVSLDESNDNAAGVLFRYQDDQNFYAFLISSDGRYDLELYKQDKLTTLIDWSEAAAIKAPGETNHLRLEILGDRIRLFANNKLLDEVSDDSFGKGKLALAASSFDKGGVTAKFDNLVVRGSK